MQTIKLSKTYAVHGKAFDEVTLREPTYKDIYISGLGTPFQWMPAPGGGFVRVTDAATIDAYVQRLAQNPSAESLADISAIDALQLERAISGFFTEAPATPSGSPTGSSSGSDGTQPQSAA